MLYSSFFLKLLFVVYLIALFTPLAFGDKNAERFAFRNVSGTLIVAEEDGTPLLVHDTARAKIRFSPASTFKVLNTLIALESGAVDGRGTRFKWDGVDRGSEAWNRSHTLQTAFDTSCVWVFQTIARKVGAERYTSDLQNLGYGNAQIGEEVDLFWLDDSLKISGMEQISFLSQLYAETLPFKAPHFAELKSIMLVEETSSYSLYAKSGWTGPALGVGWYVGYIETTEATSLFAMNMDMDKVAQAPLRKELVISALKSLDLI